MRHCYSLLANKLNFEEKVYNLEQTLHSWKRSNLTLIGRINIVKTLGPAKHVYSTSLLTILKPLIDTINKILFSFIWEGKTPKIKRKTIIAEKKRGGLKMIDFEIMERALKIAWKLFLRNIAAPANRLAPGAPISAQHFSTRLAYSKLLEKRHLAPTAKPRILKHGITKEGIQDVYLLPFRILKEAKLIMFLLKIIHGILPTQLSLFRAGLTDFDKCPLCNLESQSLNHLLITCRESMKFWDLFTRWWQIIFHQNIILSEKVILYGWHQNRSSINFIAPNYSLIIAKYHIFASNTCVGYLDFDSFLLCLKDKLGILHMLAF